MRKIAIGIIFLAASLECNICTGVAFHEKYPPFDLKIWNDRTLKASPINRPVEEGVFQDGDLSISWKTIIFEFSEIEIRYRNRLIEKVELPGGREWVDFLGDIYYADLDRNGLFDIVISPANFGSGLGSFYKTALIHFQTKTGQFRRLEFISLYFDIGDFVDLDGDGKWELLMLQLTQLESLDKKVHSYWVYVPYRVDRFNLALDRNGLSDFPKFIWFTDSPNNQPTDKLPQKEKDQYLGTLPALIESAPILPSNEKKALCPESLKLKLY